RTGAPARPCAEPSARARTEEPPRCIGDSADPAARLCWPAAAIEHRELQQRWKLLESLLTAGERQLTRWPDLRVCETRRQAILPGAPPVVLMFASRARSWYCYGELLGKSPSPHPTHQNSGLGWTEARRVRGSGAVVARAVVCLALATGFSCSGKPEQPSGRSGAAEA